MAKRPVFLAERTGASLVREVLLDFEWHPGFAVSQKQRSIRALHEAVRCVEPDRRTLEVSSKAVDSFGKSLSAFRLTKALPAPDCHRACLEAAFQGSKVFWDGGPQQLSELYWNPDGRDIKRIMRPWQAIPVRSFKFGDEEWPVEPKSAFYDWLYIRALCESEATDGVRDRLRQYDAFTDIEFNPRKSFNCQARSCALFVALAGRDALHRTETRDAFLELLEEHRYGSPAASDPCVGTQDDLLAEKPTLKKTAQSGAA